MEMADVLTFLVLASGLTIIFGTIVFIIKWADWD